MKKPEYWYKQSSVIPYRIINEKLEILFITTRKKKKWIFPKGIVEEGLTPRQSSVKEALEEAGIKGKLLSKKVGSYSYKKWGGMCNVEVFGLEVTTIFNDWEENFRDRIWVNPHEFKDYINDENNLELLFKLQAILKS